MPQILAATTARGFAFQLLDEGWEFEYRVMRLRQLKRDGRVCHDGRWYELVEA
jgi:hypothetical protein